MVRVSEQANEWTVARPGLAVTHRERALRRALHAARRRAKTATGRWRMLPDHLIIGTQKGGTSSLWDHLAAHPGVARSELKEVDYFNWFHDRPLRWYRGFFPRRRAGCLTGEASPDYLYDPRVPARVRGDLPDVKLIALLRDPVDRAISHFHHERELGVESLDLEAALAAEVERLRGEPERVGREPHYRSVALRHFSYVDRGRYAAQLERWLEHFDRDRLFICDSERFFTDPQAVYDRVLDFLGLPPFDPQHFVARNTRVYADISPDLRASLAERFRGDNERLFDLLGERFDWT